MGKSRTEHGLLSSLSTPESDVSMSDYRGVYVLMEKSKFPRAVSKSNLGK